MRPCWQKFAIFNIWQTWTKSIQRNNRHQQNIVVAEMTWNDKSKRKLKIQIYSQRNHNLHIITAQNIPEYQQRGETKWYKHQQHPCKLDSKSEAFDAFFFCEQIKQTKQNQTTNCWWIRKQRSKQQLSTLQHTFISYHVMPSSIITTHQ